jgi:acyl-CoA reductase-like NAD-dependent aldehyde dehydrogenase
MYGIFSDTIFSRTIWVNSFGLVSPQIPFGGYKQSGFGREMGSYALENYTQVKVVKHWLSGPIFP